MNEIDLQLIDANVQRIEGEIIKQFLVLKYDPKCAVSCGLKLCPAQIVPGYP